MTASNYYKEKQKVFQTKIYPAITGIEGTNNVTDIAFES